MIWQQAYDPFGRVVSGLGSDPRFSGQWFAVENGLHQNWMRDYDATLGRYIQADPLGLVDGASVYGYALQNPARWSDPRGEFVGPGENSAEVVFDPLPIGGGGSGGPAWSPIAGLGALLGTVFGSVGASENESPPQQCSPSQTHPWCIDDWEDAQAACGFKYGICMQIAGTSSYRKRQCGVEYGACKKPAA